MSQRPKPGADATDASTARTFAGFLLFGAAHRVAMLGLMVLLARLMPPEEFARVELFRSGANVLAIVLGLSFALAIQRKFFDRGLGAAELEGFIATAVAAILCFSVAATAALLAFWDTLDRTLGFQLSGAVPFLPLLASFNALYAFRLVIWQVCQRSVPIGVAQSSRIVLGASISVGLVALWGLGGEGAFWGLTLGSGLVLAAISGRLIRSFRRGLPTWASLREGLAFGLPLMPHQLATWSNNFLDRFLLVALAGPSVLGVYSLGYIFGQVLGMINHEFGRAYAPFFFGAVRDGQASRTHSIERFYLVSVGSVAVLLSVLAPLGPRFFQEAYAVAFDIVPVIALAYLFQCASTLFLQQIFYAKTTRYASWATFISAAVNVVLNVALIPILGLHGAAWATVGGLSLRFLLTRWLANRAYPVRHAASWNAMLLIPVFLCAGIYFGRELVWLGPVAGILWLVIVHRTGWFSPSDVWRLMEILSARRARRQV